MSSIPVQASENLSVTIPALVRVQAVEQVRRMHGGSQSQLMRCSDGNYYVVKFQNNPQHRRILVNEYLGTRLAGMMGLPTTPGVIVKVSEKLIGLTDELVIELPRYRVPCLHGLQFGSRYFGNPRNLRTADCIPGDEIYRIENPSDLIGMMVFDKWTCNCDSRQCLFLLKDDGKYSMVGIDEGFCFNGGEWNFPDSPLRGLYGNKTIYREVESEDSFEPWLGKLENGFTFETITQAAQGIPTEWYEGDGAALSKLLKELDRRRRLVRTLIRNSCQRMPLIFPKWLDSTRSSIPKRRQRQVMHAASSNHLSGRSYGDSDSGLTHISKYKQLFT